jgi:hypothetical protein
MHDGYMPCYPGAKIFSKCGIAHIGYQLCHSFCCLARGARRIQWHVNFTLPTSCNAQLCIESAQLAITWWCPGSVGIRSFTLIANRFTLIGMCDAELLQVVAS